MTSPVIGGESMQWYGWVGFPRSPAVAWVLFATQVPLCVLAYSQNQIVAAMFWAAVASQNFTIALVCGSQSRNR